MKEIVIEKTTPCPNCKRMKAAMQVIRTWASVHYDKYWELQPEDHEEKLRDIRDKCEEALNEKKET